MGTYQGDGIIKNEKYPNSNIILQIKITKMDFCVKKAHNKYAEESLILPYLQRNILKLQKLNVY